MARKEIWFWRALFAVLFVTAASSILVTKIGTDVSSNIAVKKPFLIEVVDNSVIDLVSSDEDNVLFAPENPVFGGENMVIDFSITNRANNDLVSYLTFEVKNELGLDMAEITNFELISDVDCNGNWQSLSNWGWTVFDVTATGVKARLGDNTSAYPNYATYAGNHTYCGKLNMTFASGAVGNYTVGMYMNAQ